MQVHVLLYDAGQDTEGIHSLEVAGETIVLMFENNDDADRYSGLLEAQDFPLPSVQALDREEIEIFCEQSGYIARFIETGFVPNTEEDRLLLVPPESNREVDNWKEIENKSSNHNEEDRVSKDSVDLDDIRKSLEGLL